MLAEAGKNNPPINFNRQFPGSAQTVVDTHEVPGAFSKGGWAFMKDAIAHADRYFSGEQWVLGDQARGHHRSRQTGTGPQGALLRRLREGVARLHQIRVGGAVCRPEGRSQKLMQLSGNQSPLLELFSLASQNTAVDDPSRGRGLPAGADRRAAGEHATASSRRRIRTT